LKKLEYSVISLKYDVWNQEKKVTKRDSLVPEELFNTLSNGVPRSKNPLTSKPVSAATVR